jgi:hypothetical protein
MNIEKTYWAKQFKKECYYFYNEAIEYASNKDTIYEIYKSNDLGYYMWHICVKNSDFWMCSFKTKKECEILCKKMNWNIDK